MIIYLLPILAVISGYLLVVAIKPKSRNNLKLLLAFSGAFLLSITIFEILPEAYDPDNSRTIGLFILLGILLQIVLEFFSKGAEHGHMHFHGEKTFPWSLFVSLCLHAFLEGLPIHEGNDLVYGILVHKIPVAFILTTFLIQVNMSKVKIGLALFAFAAMTPLGTYFTNQTNILEGVETLVTALVVGTFLHISTIILFESSEGHKFNLNKLLMIVLGIGIAYLL